MLSTGNDIVSLTAINKTRTNQPGFYSRILSDTEKTLYVELEAAAIPFENFVWLLWSIKESAYKYLYRINPGLVFSPTKFAVQQIELPFGYTETNFEGTETEGVNFDHKAVLKSVITFGCDTLYSRSLMYRELVVSVVNGDKDFENTNWGIKLINSSDPEYQSNAVRAFLVNRLNKLFHLDDLIVGKSTHGVPIVLKGDVKLGLSVSLSHHDQMVAYSFQLE
ncbi:4'-phosphopantetheinyl transferase family protein [Mucilaginibacter gotjawali]|uniref:Phosphopantetheinyl transferase (Holo-ACP synthase) n=2 Tax=Mucilaginibacter gotjawali TaxID=1550579 RepID=A0A839S810_9SPHI|nr:4'-phosphopantetheinyl transferase superfamily protein [Mucilaginibacter gotjawali]MBB3054055.1 phosphopantetheinyl transferase (holo-ACP synthase) [Mucilaginibacter gotjawali]BAU54324.1 4'-phosphopantetheinyl transferase superfamily protein [Mucilaginibacter gotjawali]